MGKPRNLDKISKKEKASRANTKKNESRMPNLNLFLTASCIGIAAWFSYKGYLETRVNTPYSMDKLVKDSGLENQDRYWGTYRPGVYFGLKTRDPHSMITGLMWYSPHSLRQDGSGLRHWCEQNDRLNSYAWLEHDGKSFGIQEIVDGRFKLTTSFVKKLGGNHGGDWTARITATQANKTHEGEEISLLFYTAIEESTKGWIRSKSNGDNRPAGIEGKTLGLGTFNIEINPTKGAVVEHSSLSTIAPGFHVLKETVLQNLKIMSEKTNPQKRYIVLSGEQLPSNPNGKKIEPNFIVTQITGQLPFEIEISFQSGSYFDRSAKLMGKNYEVALEKQRSLFNEKFDNIFKLKSKGYKNDEIKFAKMALSNMVGSIGFFYGNSQVQSEYTKVPVPYWKSALYTAVPSRSFFPRGFLWDEGFHGLLISTWDLEIELDIINHWFDFMNIEGWIPREMILGQEAMAKVPEEFVTQINTNANPPMFFLTLNFMLTHNRDSLMRNHFDFLEKLYPRLQTWFHWFNTTQNGLLSGTYRWRGRNSTTNRELNPKTLTSGLDDYPRASHPNLDERHIDLRCWIALSAGILSKIAEILNQDTEKYESTYQYLSDNDFLNEMHWSPIKQSYSDYGLHTDQVTLRRPTPHSQHHGSVGEMTRITLEEPTLKFVDSAFGYVSLFPLIVQIIDESSPELGKVLQDLTNPDLLWTKYGLRSLAKNSPFYMKYNTEHDPPYWRGPIWINLNYLVVRSLHHYAQIDGPYRSKAKEVYDTLRKNLINNVIKQYKNTGYIWENYGDSHGEGKGSHPFTGWTSLVVLLMAEIY